MLNSVKKQLITYFMEELQPIKISAPLREWKKLNYRNPLFTVQFDPEPKTLYFNYKTTHNTDNYYNTPIVSLTNLILGKYYLNTPVAKITYKSPYDETILEYDTCGKMPSRWIKMIHDFSNVNFNLEEGTFEEQKKIIDKIETMNDANLLYNTIMISNQPQNYSVKIIDTQCGEWYVRDAMKTNPISYSAQILFNEAMKCKSLYPILIDKNDSQRYNLLFSDINGIRMDYFNEFAYSGLIHSFGKSERCIYGDTKYSCNAFSNVPFEEYVIFGQLLKKCGYSIIEKKNNYVLK